ncbi:MAG TPA: DNA/RNA non-specific endonuclease [Allosphingosinicella sp.]|nr:DNA/RNA non-specific endonuclease [Allosphingosinicella sp.]
MSELQRKLDKLRAAIREVREQDPELAEESESAVREGRSDGPEAAGPAQAIGLESIIMRRERPVLAIKNDSPELVFREEADSRVWKRRLADAAPRLRAAIPAVGRIELQGGDLEWVGTGWLVREDILVTNRHVAVEFARRNGEGFSFRDGHDGAMVAAVDFLQEIGSDDKSRIFELLRPLHIEEAPGPDLAFFRVRHLSGGKGLAPHILLAESLAPTRNAAVIGYPAYDSRIPDSDLMEDIYGRIYNKKRLAPGAVTRIEETRLLHNCTTLGGNSGSVVLDLASGKALGLHFSGAFLTSNYAVRADVVADRLDKVERGVGPRPPTPSPPPPSPSATGPESQPAAAGTLIHRVTIPLTVTVTVTAGEPAAAPATSGAAGRPAAARPEDDVAGEEGVAEAIRGNFDSMHVTNTTPQMQAFNAPIWLGLEDYALEHAREDRMKISVFTGPYLTGSDPVLYGVAIPTRFWKVIAFIHDETRILCATGYEMDQSGSLQPEEEFVFGPFESKLGTAAQVRIASIAESSGIDFGRLALVDPMSAVGEAGDVAGPAAALAAFEQIRFR